MPKREVLKEHFNWYESGLPSKERKRRGHYSTPSLLVEQILDACGYTPEADLAALRVLDPACGSGNFLAGTARRLLAFGRRTHLAPEELTTLLQRNLWGLDPDPVACFLAEMQLRTTLAAAQDIGASIAGILGDEIALHIYQADSLMLPWEPCVDLLVTNPPYLAAKNSDLSGYQFAQQRGQVDSYLLFLNMALSVVRPGGWIGLVLPDPLLARANAARERRHLLEEFTLHHLWHLADVFAAHVGAVVLIAQKCLPKRGHLVEWVRGRWGQEASTTAPSQGTRPDDHKWREGLGDEAEGCKGTCSDTPCTLSGGEVIAKKPGGLLRSGGSGAGGPAKTIPQALFLRQPSAEFRYLLSEPQGATIERLRAHLEESPDVSRRFAPLSEFLSIHRGEELGRKNSLLIGQPQLPEPSLPGRAFPELRGRGLRQGGITCPPDREPCLGGRYPAPLPYTECDPQSSYGRGDPCGRPWMGDDDRLDGTDQWYPVLRGGLDIHPYVMPQTQWWIARKAIRKPLARYQSPKLLVVKSTNRLQATLDMQGHVALQTLYLLHPRKKESGQDDLYFFLALLNSRLLQTYVYMLHTAYKWVQPQIEQSVLARLPIPLIESHQRDRIIELAKLLANACSKGDPVVEWKQDITRMYEELECAIVALYEAATTKES